MEQVRPITLRLNGWADRWEKRGEKPVKGDTKRYKNTWGTE
jgi:hypothetical protein